jgi:hypothetical protein
MREGLLGRSDVRGKGAAGHQNDGPGERRASAVAGNSRRKAVTISSSLPLGKSGQIPISLRSDQRKTIKLDGEKRSKFKALGVDVVRGES